MYPFSDHVYATKAGVNLELRVLRSPAVKEGEKAPWLFWSHGGAFVFCYHQGVTGWAQHAFLERGYHIVSWSYRLAPCASLAMMIEDGADAFAWCRAHLPSLLSVDIDRYAVGGDSAGGCLATLLGGILSPAPRAVLDDQGLTDLTDAWFDTHPDSPVFSGEFTPAEIEAAAADRDPTHALIGAPCFDGIAPTQEAVRAEFGSETVMCGRAERLQCDVRQYLAARSAWVRATVHPEEKTEAQVKAALKEWSPLYRLDRLQSYPPTFFIHGEADECVPASQSRRMAARLREMGVQIGEHYEPGEGHCFNQKYGGDDRTSVEGYDRCVTAPLDFIDKHVKN